jgi:hypothetical protein
MKKVAAGFLCHSQSLQQKYIIHSSHFVTQNIKKMCSKNQKLIKLAIYFTASSKTFLNKMGRWSCNSRTLEAEAGGFQVQGQPELYSETQSQETKGWGMNLSGRDLLQHAQALGSIPSNSIKKKKRH